MQREEKRENDIIKNRIYKKITNAIRTWKK
jgi:hypothetical protein